MSISQKFFESCAKSNQNITNLNHAIIREIKKMRPQFRSYFQNIVDMMLNQKESIKSFIERNQKSLKKSTKLGAFLGQRPKKQPIL